MKKILVKSHAVAFLAIFTLFTSCISSQSWVPVKGSGEAVDKSYDISDFQGIEVSGGFDVILVQGNSEAVTLTAQENLFEYITVKVEAGMLKIYTENNIMSTRPMKARISFTSIDRLRVSGGGDVTAETPVEVPELSIELSGGGDVSSVVNTGKLYGHISGGGDMDIEMNTEKMKCSVSGGGDATLTGQANELEITINGGGNVHAGNFTAHIASFQASGGSDIYVNASEEITGQISGGGDVYYSGTAERINIDAKGGSEIHKQ